MFDREEPANCAQQGPYLDRAAERVRDDINKANDKAAFIERESSRGVGRLAYAGEAAGPMNAIRPANFGLEGYGSQELSLDNVEAAFTYQPMHQGQIENAEQVRDALVAAAKVILRNVPRSPRRTLALQHLVNARMDANCAISFGGRF